MAKKMGVAFLFVWLSAALAGCGMSAAGGQEIEEKPKLEAGVNEPPIPTITIGNEPFQPVLGAYSWEIENSDGTKTREEVDIAPPHEQAKHMDSIAVAGEDELEIDFGSVNPPKPMDFHIWEGGKRRSVDGDMLLTDYKGTGSVIVELYGEWHEGHASYVFVLEVR
ncbi:MAG: Lipoprotein [Shouchella clausii]